MSDNSVVHIGENSPEHVAFQLMRIIAASENKVINPAGANADRAWLLDTYAECHEAVRGHRVIRR